MDGDLAASSATQQASRHFNVDISGSAQAHLGDHFGDVHHHHYAPPVGRKETPPSPSSTVPFRRDADFVDRGDLLTQLEQRCSEPAARVALVGIGGVGKSQLAIEYCHRLRQRSPDTWVFWVHASTVDRVTQGFREIADEAEIPGCDDPQADIPELVRKWLRKGRQRWLLVLDNLDDDALLTLRQKAESTSSSEARRQPPRRLSEYIPQVANGALLITTRTMAVANELTEPQDITQIGPMTQGEAVNLLARKLGSSQEIGDLKELALILEFMPLAMIQAAAYIRRRVPRCSVRDYINEFDQDDDSKKGLLNYEAGHLRRDHEAGNSIINSWQISFEHIRQKWPSSADLLSLMSFSDRQGIPEYVLTAKLEAWQFPDHESVADVSTKFDADIERLRDYSLVSVELDGHTFAMHRLVQLATRDWLTKNAQDQNQQAVFLGKLYQGFPAGAQETWPRCEELLPHVVGAEALLHDQDLDADALYCWGWTLYKAAMYLRLKGQYRDAERMCRKSIRAFEQAVPKDDVAISRGWNMLAQIYIYQGKASLAEALSLRVMKEQRRTPSDDDEITKMRAMHNLAAIYADQGRIHEAEELQKKVLETSQKIQGQNHRDTLSSMVGLSAIYQEQGRLEEAESLQSRALEVLKLVQGEEHYRTLDCAIFLAVTLRNQGRLEEAEVLASQTLEVQKRTLGQEHPQTLDSIHCLAWIRHQQQRFEEAEILATQVLEVRRRNLGEDHRNTLSSMQCLGSIRARQRRLAEAEALTTQVFETRKRILGDENPDTLDSMNALGSILSDQGRYDEALALFTVCHQLRAKVLGPTHPHTYADSTWLARLKGQRTLKVEGQQPQHSSSMNQQQLNQSSEQEPQIEESAECAH